MSNIKVVKNYGTNLYIDFTAEEVEAFLIKRGYIIEDFRAEVRTRCITGNDGGGGVELSNWYNALETRRIAYNGDRPVDFLEERDYIYNPNVVFKKILKEKLLNL